MTDPNTQLQQLRAMRDQLPEDMRAQFDAQIAALEGMLQQPATPPEQTITNTASNQGAQGVFYGNVYLYGQRGRQASELIGAYLERQVRRCGSLPLQGVYEQKASDDILAISLEQVYTQLAIQGLTVREEYAGEPLAAFDAAAYLEQHRGTHLLPAWQREQFVAHGAPSRREMGGLADRSLAMLDADALARLAQESERLSFLGPQLVTEAITQHQQLVLLGEPGSGKVRRMTARVIARNAPQVGAVTCEVNRLTGRGNTYGNTACR